MLLPTSHDLCCACVALATVLALPRHTHAQDFCPAALKDRPFANLRNARQPLESDTFYSVTWDAALNRAFHLDSLDKGLIHGSGGYELSDWYIDASDIAVSLRRSIAADTTLQRNAAFDLSHLFEGGPAGATEGMAYVAASIYSDWRLPPEPAAAFLADPTFGIRARVRAVRALEPYWSTQTFRRAAAAALCSLAARMSGVSSMRSDSAISVLSLLNEDEFDLVGDIEAALRKAHERGGPSPTDVLELLPQTNLLTKWLAKQLSFQ